MKKPNLTFRKAGQDDCQTLFDWRNDPVTRENSIRGDLVTWEQHLSWFKEVLHFTSRKVWMANLGHELIGWVRVDQGDEGVELSWLVAPEFRGQGLGKIMLSKFVAENPGPYIARVKVGNGASMAIAAEAGFTTWKQERDVIWLRHTPARG